MDKLRIGVVGAGIMGQWHARVYRDDPRCEVVAVSDLNGNRADEFAQEFSISSVFETHGDMLDKTELDAVSVCTPDFAHAGPAVDAAEAGKHVLIEKPLAVSVQDAEVIIETVRRKGVTAMAQFSHRWIPSYRKAKHLLAGGALGEPVMAYARKNDRIYVPTKMIGWADRTTPCWFLSSHDIDLVCWLFESVPVEVYANAVSKVLVSRGVNTPDAVQAQVRFADGAVATFESCWIYPDTFPTMTDSFIEVITTGSVVHLDRKQEQVEISTEQEYSYPRNLLFLEYEDGVTQGAVPLAIRHFVTCVLEGREPLVDLESSLVVTRILDAAQRSIDAAGPVSIKP